eukprot:94341-Alexandrium_andersonii.AAC.1
MSASLVGSEMCIRDRDPRPREAPPAHPAGSLRRQIRRLREQRRGAHPSRASGIDVEAVPGPAQFKPRTASS